MALLLYAVENGVDRGFLITTTENEKKDLDEWNGKEFVNSNFTFMNELNNQTIIPLYNAELLNKTNLQIEVDFDDYTTYHYLFEETYKIRKLEVTFDIEGERIEEEVTDITAFDLTIVDKRKNIVIDIFNKKIKSINGKKINDDDLNFQLNELLDKYELCNNFCILLEEFEEFTSTQNIVELADIKRFIDIEEFINELYEIIIKGANNEN